jgi:hypothetical protein
MAAGLGYIEFATGDILTAAVANGYLASQTVMVFANAAARTSAIASPQEGMFSYLKDTNATEYYTGSAWAAVGGGGASTQGLTLISTASFSGASSVSLANNSFTSTYTNYKLLINISTFTNGSNQYLNGRLRASGTDNSTSNYTSQFFVLYQTSSGTSNDVGSANQNAFSRFGYLYTGAAHTMNVDILNPQTSLNTSYTGTVSGMATEQWLNSGYFNANTSFDSFTFYPAAGTLTGSYSLYGYNK